MIKQISWQTGGLSTSGSVQEEARWSELGEVNGSFFVGSYFEYEKLSNITNALSLWVSDFMTRTEVRNSPHILCP